MRTSINKLRNKKGFTLIELIMVLAVLAIIMALAVPRFGGVREQAKVDSDMATLASIAKLAEFEFVRLDGDYEEVDVSNLISKNFVDDTIFQSDKLIGEESVSVTFDADGKVTSIDIGDYKFEYLDGKFTPPEGFIL